MQFFRDDALPLLWLLAVVWGLFLVTDRRKRNIGRLFAWDRTLGKIATNFSPRKAFLRKLFLWMAIGCMLIALARPQWGEKTQTLKRKGVDIVFMLDTSLSMLAEDLKPNRMKLAKRNIRMLTERLGGDRIGLVAFSGSAFLQVPLTLDYAAFQLFMDAVDVGFIPDPGTHFPEAITTAVQAFEETDEEHRVCIIFSDGESHEGTQEELLRRLNDAHVRVYAVGTGTKEGAPIPLRSDARTLGGFKKDRRGETVVSTLDDGLLKALAEGTGGLYFSASASGRAMQRIYDDIQSMDKKEMNEQEMTAREDRFQIFLAVAFLLLALETVIGERKGSGI